MFSNNLLAKFSNIKYCLTPEDGTDRLLQNVCKKPSLYAAKKPQNSATLIYTVAESWNYATFFRLNYITTSKNTHIQSWMVTHIMKW